MLYSDPERTKNDINIPDGLFSGTQIEYCIAKYRIIENADIKNCIREATYEMRLGKKAIRWDNKEKKEFNVESDGHIVLEPNSVTFVTTIERFNLPHDIVARFNLKSKMVHRGLLLGTGPIVDPGFQSRILIPIHNFSNQPVRISYGDRFISVEFTKCCDPYKTYQIDSSQKTQTHVLPKKEEDVSVFIKNTFLTGSSIRDAINEYQRQQKKSEKIVERAKNIFTIAVVAMLVGIFTLLLNTFNTINTSTKRINEFKEEIIILRQEINKLQSDMEESENKNENDILTL